MSVRNFRGQKCLHYKHLLVIKLLVIQDFAGQQILNYKHPLVINHFYLSLRIFEDFYLSLKIFAGQKSLIKSTLRVIKGCCLSLRIFAGQKSLITSTCLRLRICCLSLRILLVKNPDFCLSLRICKKILIYKHLLLIKDVCLSFKKLLVNKDAP